MFIQELTYLNLIEVRKLIIYFSIQTLLSLDSTSFELNFNLITKQIPRNIFRFA
jgi:hypothetical protein